MPRLWLVVPGCKADPDHGFLRWHESSFVVVYDRPDKDT